MTDIQKLALEVLKAAHRIEQDHYRSMYMACWLLPPAAIIGLLGNLWLWTR